MFPSSLKKGIHEQTRKFRTPPSYPGSRGLLFCRNLDLQALSPEDRENFRIALENLKQTIQNKLDTPSQHKSNLV
jgi:hypothetical protein